ncbi:MAG: hypothetical protein SO125_09380 [Eubacteriales bacterium]|nr:hypothetical protein [Eubacteriales bacterium]MDY4899151.1 hypothetical protein [Eubacteriales bacterium]
MSTEQTITKTGELAGLIYKNMKMGADSIINLLPKTDDDTIKSHMTQILDGYEAFAARAKSALESQGGQAREEGTMAKMSAKMGMSMKTMVDSTASHIAELLMEGCVMGICETTRTLRSFENSNCSEDMLKLCREIIAFEENNFEQARKFL